MVIIVNVLLAVIILISEKMTVSGSVGTHQLSIMPLDPDVCIGQNITFMCSLLVPPTSNASIGFETVISRTWVQVNESDILVANETLSIYPVMVSSREDYQFIRCFYDDKSTRPNSVETTLTIYTRPEEITDFNCIVHNYVESMTCSWNYGVLYNAMPNVTFQWKDQRLTQWTGCSHLHVKDGSCMWRSSTDGDFTMKKLAIKITLEQKCGINVSSTFNVDTSKKVKPEPVVGLLAAVLNSTCIKLSWKTINSRPEYPKKHRVSWSSEWGDNREEEFSTPAGTKQVEKIYCELRPFTQYTFSVYMKPEDEGYSSDLRTVEATTFSDKPSASPEVIDGGYRWSPSDCQRSSHRTVCLLWKPIMDIDRNGVLRGYDVTFTPNISAADGNATFTEVNGTYGCSPLLLCNTSYMVQIAARNENGTSEKYSSLDIPSADFGIVQPDISVEMGNITNGIGDVYVSWPHPQEQQAFNFTVFWCLKQMGDCKGSSIVEWQTFNSDTTEAVLQIDTPDYYVYGVSMRSQHGCSGFEWQSCLYTKYQRPKLAPQNVMVLHGLEENTLLVTWDKLCLKSIGPIIKSYIVQYCSEDDCEETDRIPASGPALTFLNGLDGNRTYTVTVRGVSRDGLEGPKNQMVKDVVLKSKENITLD